MIILGCLVGDAGTLGAHQQEVLAGLAPLDLLDLRLRLHWEGVIAEVLGRIRPDGHMVGSVGDAQLVRRWRPFEAADLLGEGHNTGKPELLEVVYPYCLRRVVCFSCFGTIAKSQEMVVEGKLQHSDTHAIEYSATIARQLCRRNMEDLILHFLEQAGLPLTVLNCLPIALLSSFQTLLSWSRS